MTAQVRVPTGVPERAPALHGVNAMADQWVAVGPGTVVRGQATLRPRVSGRIRALAVSPDGQRIYAGTALGGVWYSDSADGGDGGDRWTPLDFYASAQDANGVRQHADALTVGAIGVVWDTPATDVVYVGAGEHPTIGLETPSSALQGVGIRVSTGPAVAVAPLVPAGAPVVGAAAADPWRVEAVELAGLAVNQFARDLVTDGAMWAATSRGLYRRMPAVAAVPAAPGVPAVPAVPVQWTKIVTPLGDGEISTVVAVAGVVAAEPQRVYIASATGRMASSIDGVAWQTIELPAFPEAQVPASVQITRVRLTVANGPAHPVIYALADGPRLWRIDVAAVERVTGLLRVMTAADPNGQAPFGLAIAAHPTNDLAHQDMIVVGGQTFDFPEGRRQAALFLGKVTHLAGAWTIVPAAAVDGAPAEWIGAGIPAGVHALAWVVGPGPTHLWVGGDGGAFRSTRNGERSSFVERNTGLSAIEVTTLAQASDCDTVMLVGTRSNGVLRRRSGETWDVVANGRAGGVAIDPGNARCMYAQLRGSAWRYSDNGGRTFRELPFRTSAPTGLSAADATKWAEDKKAEDEGSAPISRLALKDVPGSPRGTLKALGTNRIWYTDDALKRARDKAAALPGAGRVPLGWVTLPTGTDPYAAGAGAPALKQDCLNGKEEVVLVCCWGTEDRLYVMTSQCVYLFQRNADATWRAAEKLYDQIEAKKNWKRKTPKGLIPDDLPLLSLAVRRAEEKKGTLYVGVSGPSDKQHLWWHDGNGRWLSTGFARDTPVYAIAVDPRHDEIVYIGTGAGVFKGTGTFPPNGDPTWVWALYSDGLPNAPCVDLALYSPTGAAPRLLRAALAGRGVWEVALDNVKQGPEVYVRSHGFDSRRSDAPAGGPRDPLCTTRGQTSLDASPDIRIWRAPGAAPPEPVDYDIAAASDPYDVWRMMSALRAAGEDLDPREGWNNALTPPARERVRKALPPPLPSTPKQLWEALLVDNPLPHDRTPPDAADLVAYMRDEPDRWPKGSRTSCVSGDGTARVYVTVHSRHWRPIVNGTLRVALLKTKYARHHSLEATTPLPDDWGGHLRADRDTVAAGPWPPGSPAWLTAASWAYADPANPFRTVGGRFDPDNPQVVVFDISLSGAETWNTPGWLLLAVVLVGDVAGLAEQDVATLVRTDRRVAARSVRRAALPPAPLTVYGGMDTRDYGNRAAMEHGWRDSNLMVTGLYLDSPALVPGEIRPENLPVLANAIALGQIEPPRALVDDPLLDLHYFNLGHNRNGNNPLPNAPTAWMRARGEIWPAWGLLPIYFGQQDRRNGDSQVGNPHRWNAKGPFDLRVFIGVANGADAAAKALAAGFPTGAVIYIDWEIVAAPDVAHDLLRDNYLNAFWHELAARGYRPGVYCRPNVSPALRNLCPGLFVWSVNNDNSPAAPNAIVTPAPAKLVLRTPELTNPNAPDVDAIARQWRLDFTQPAGNPVPEIFQLQAGVRHIDGNVSVVADPSFPERRVLTTRLPVVLTTRIRGGRVTAAPTVAGQCAIYTVRRSRPARASGALGAMVRDPGADLVKDDVKFLWNPFSVPASLRVPGPAAAPDPTDVFLALGIAELEGEDVWRLQALRKPPALPWLHETVPDTGFALDPLSGVAAETRGDGSIDAFVVMDPAVRNGDDGQLAVARWNPTTFSWSPLRAIAGATARRTNRHAAVSRATGIADVFWIDSFRRVATSTSAAADPTAWGPILQIGVAAVTVHPFANLAAVARDVDRIDVLYIGMDPISAAWRLIDVWWMTAGGWGANSQVAGGIVTNVESLASIAACNRDADHLDAFVVGLDDGALYVTTLTRGADTWSPLRPIGGAPASRLASVDSGCSHGANDIQVVVSGRDGNVYATSWDTTAGEYGALRQIVVLNV